MRVHLLILFTNHKKLFNYDILKLIFIFTLFTSSVYSYEVVESIDSVEDTNLKIIKLLNNLTEDKIEPLEKTRGFSYRYSPVW